jgi:hypothetical protein
MNDWQMIDIQPLDVVGVRDGRPFDVGGTVHARSVFPPPPWTILGALRTLLIEQAGVDPALYGNRADESAQRRACIEKAREVAGTPDGLPPWMIGPVLLGCPGAAAGVDVTVGDSASTRAALMFPQPLDLEVFAEAAGRRVKRLRAAPLPDGYAASLQPGLLMPVVPGGERPDGDTPAWFLTPRSMEAYLAGGLPSWTAPDRQRPVFLGDARIGVALDSKVVREGYLYVRHTVALAPGYCLRVPVRGLTDRARRALSDLRGVLRLGGDGHAARVSVGRDVSLPRCGELVGRRAAIYFASPTVLDDISDERLSSLAGAPVRTVARMTRRGVSLGGWKMGIGPRVMKRLLPAGTVLHVEAEGADWKRLHGMSVAADDEDRAAGLGFALVGRLED